MKQIWKFWKDYFFYNSEKWGAIFLILFIVSMELSLVYLNVQFNEWRNGFYNGLQALDKNAFINSIKVFMILALTYVGIWGYKTYLTQKLQINWRNFMTKHKLQQWLNTKTYYGTQFVKNYGDNFDQRISEDINSFVSSSLSLSLGVLSAVTTFFSFIFILWTLSDSITLSIYGHNITIGHYLVWGVLIYSVFGTFITRKIGRKLKKLSYDQELLEANFRYSLMRTRENSESIALYKGEQFESEVFDLKFAGIVENFKKIITKQKYLNWWSSYFSQIAVVFPYIVCAPRFFSKAIKLGDLMQTASAFDSVQTSLSWVVDSYADLMQFMAVVSRLSGFEDAIAKWHSMNQDKKLKVIHSGNKFYFENLEIKLPNSNRMLHNQSFSFETGKKYIITGRNGTGKSTLIRTIANIWPYADGTINFPKDSKPMFISQASYMPVGTLLNCITYPSSKISKKQKKKLIKLMHALELDGLTDENILNTKEDWNKIFSGGQKQKIAIIRAILQQPDILMLDESTSSMDQESEAAAYNLLISQLPKTTIISVSHRNTIDKFHSCKIHLKNNKLEGVKI